MTVTAIIRLWPEVTNCSHYYEMYDTMCVLIWTVCYFCGGFLVGHVHVISTEYWTNFLKHLVGNLWQLLVDRFCVLLCKCFLSRFSLLDRILLSSAHCCLQSVLLYCVYFPAAVLLLGDAHSISSLWQVWPPSPSHSIKSHLSSNPSGLEHGATSAQSTFQVKFVSKWHNQFTKPVQHHFAPYEKL